MNGIEIRGTPHANRCLVGQRISTTKDSGTQVFALAGPSTTSVTSASHAPDDMSRRDDSGAKTVTRLFGWDDACRSGNESRVARLVRRRASRGTRAMVHSRSTGERYYDEHWLDIQFRHWVLPTRVHTYIVLPVFGVATTFILIALLGNQESGFATLGLMLGPIAALAWFCRHQWWVGQSIAKVKASMVESIEDSTQFRLGDKPSGGDVR